MKKISFIITAFNEEGNIKELYRQIEEVTSIYENYIFEYIFVDNGSADDGDCHDADDYAGADGDNTDDVDGD